MRDRVTRTVIHQPLHTDMACYCRKPYGFWKFIGDVIMTCLTAGFWLIWIFIREMRNR